MPDNPTPVNISDLPVAQSANGVRLVGDDSGTTKQVPVSLLADEISPGVKSLFIRWHWTESYTRYMA